MDIAFVHPTHPSAGGDGATFTATKLVEGLLSRGHNVTLFCLREGDGGDGLDADIRVLNTDGIRPFNVKINNALRRRRSEFTGFDIVHSYKTRSIPAMIDIAAEIDAATLVSLTAYGGICPKNDLFYKNETVCSRSGYARCARCAAATASRDGESPVSDAAATLKWTASRLLNHRQNTAALSRIGRLDAFHTYTDHMKTAYTNFGFPPEKIYTIDNILDDDFRWSGERLRDDSLDLLYVGRLIPAKGVDKLVPIYERVAEHLNRQVTLTILGDGERYGAIKEQATRSDHAAGIDLRGYVPYEKLPVVYRNHDLVLTPQEWDEPFGRVYIEALASGTPVISSDSGAASEILGEGGVVTGRGIDEFADTVVDVVTHGRLETLSQRTTECVDRYKKERVLPQFEQLYKNLID